MLISVLTKINVSRCLNMQVHPVCSVISRIEPILIKSKQESGIVPFWQLSIEAFFIFLLVTITSLDHQRLFLKRSSIEENFCNKLQAPRDSNQNKRTYILVNWQNIWIQCSHRLWHKMMSSESTEAPAKNACSAYPALIWFKKVFKNISNFCR